MISTTQNQKKTGKTASRLLQRKESNVDSSSDSDSDSDSESSSDSDSDSDLLETSVDPESLRIHQSRLKRKLTKDISLKQNENKWRKTSKRASNKINEIVVPLNKHPGSTDRRSSPSHNATRNTNDRRL